MNLALTKEWFEQQVPLDEGLDVAAGLPYPLFVAQTEMMREREMGRTEATALLLAAAREAEANPPPTAILIPAQGPAKPKLSRARANLKDGLVVMEAEPYLPEGDCPGGRYYLLRDPVRAAELLRYWAEHRAWAAIDLETGRAWREQTDPATGAGSRYFLDDLIDPFTCCIYLCSVSVEPGVAVVFDMRELGPDAGFVEAFREFLRQGRLIAHNSMFEQSFFLAQFGVEANICYDTLLVHQMATAGLRTPNGLAALMERYLDIKLDKEWQEFFLKIHPESPIPNEAIRYSAGDVCQLLKLAEIVQETLERSGMEPIWTEIEKPMMPILARARWRGIEIDLDVLRKIRTELETQIAEIHGRFLAIVGERIYTKGKKNPVEVTEPAVNIRSNPQVGKWLAAHGVNTDTVKEEALKTLIMGCPGSPAAELMQIVLDYRAGDKALGTYVIPLLEKYPNPITGRLHPGWKQLEAMTGRMSCEDPPMQTIPSLGPWAKIRKAVKAREGCRLITADYSQIELRLLADQSREPKMVEVFVQGHQITRAIAAYIQQHDLPENVADLKKSDTPSWKEIAAAHPELVRLLTEASQYDLHTRTASVLFGVPIAAVTSEQRKLAKVFNFAIAYGAGPPALVQQALAQGLSLTIEAAKALLEKFYDGYPALKQYLDLQKLRASQQGYTTTLAGRKRFYTLPNMAEKKLWLERIKADHEQQVLQIEQEVEEYFSALDPSMITIDAWGDRSVVDEEYGPIGFSEIVRRRRRVATEWEKISEKWHGEDPYELARRMVRYETAAIEREGANHGIQGANADCLKVATLLIEERLKKLSPACNILMWVHDEIVAEAPEEIAEEAGHLVVAAMIEAAERYLTVVPCEVSLAIAPYWSK